MMTEGWGTDWLPVAVQRRVARDDAHEARESKRAEEERERRAEERHAAALAAYQEAATARGELVSAVALATGQVAGRSIADILAAASLAADRDDVVTEARLHRNGHGEPERVHVEVAEPRILQPAARSGTGWKIAQRARHFHDLLTARAKLAEAERAAEQSRLDYGLVEGVTRRTREDDDPLIVASASRRGGGPVPDGHGLRIRNGGVIVGIR